MKEENQAEKQLVYLNEREFLNPFRPFIDHQFFRQILDTAHTNAVHCFLPSMILFGMEYSFERNLVRLFSKRADFSFEPTRYAEVLLALIKVSTKSEQGFKRVLYVISVSTYAIEGTPFSELGAEEGFLITSLSPLEGKYSFYRKVDDIKYKYELKSRGFVPLDVVMKSRPFQPIIYFWRNYLPKVAEECERFYDKLSEIFEGGKK
jgi:hypothetical protein